MGKKRTHEYSVNVLLLLLPYQVFRGHFFLNGFNFRNILGSGSSEDKDSLFQETTNFGIWHRDANLNATAHEIKE
jgi:hypothetical protein